MDPRDQARQIGVIESWLAQYLISDTQTNPPNATVCADTGQLAAGYYDIYFFASCSSALGVGNLYFAWRDAANTANLILQMIMASGAVFHEFVLKDVKVLINERFRFTVGAAIVGTLVTSIIAIKRG